MKIQTGLLITLLALGCGGEEEATEAAEAAAALEGAAEALEGAAEATAEAEGAAEAAEAAAGEGTEAAGQGASAATKGLQALGQVLAAAQNAEGGTPCETAYNASIAMIESMRKNLPADRQPSEDDIPSKEDFVARCSQLPPEAQQCMTMAYAMAHQQECQAVMQSPEVQAFRESMRPGAGE